MPRRGWIGGIVGRVTMRKRVFMSSTTYRFHVDMTPKQARIYLARYRLNQSRVRCHASFAAAAS